MFEVHENKTAPRKLSGGVAHVSGNTGPGRATQAVNPTDYCTGHVNSDFTSGKRVFTVSV